jgi:hypothetical protein
VLAKAILLSLTRVAHGQWSISGEFLFLGFHLFIFCGFLLIFSSFGFFFGFMGLPVWSFLNFFKINIYRFELFKI